MWLQNLGKTKVKVKKNKFLGQGREHFRQNPLFLTAELPLVAQIFQSPTSFTMEDFISVLMGASLLGLAKTDIKQQT